MVEKPICPRRREEETDEINDSESLGSLSSIRHFERHHEPL